MARKILSTELQFSEEASAEEPRSVCQHALTSGRGAEPLGQVQDLHASSFSFDGFMEFHAMPLKLLGHFYLDSYRLLYGSFLLPLVQLSRILDPV